MYEYTYFAIAIDYWHQLHVFDTHNPDSLQNKCTGGTNLDSKELEHIIGSWDHDL